MKKIMIRAWEIAYQGQAEFGGKVSEYFSEALKEAWSEYHSNKDSKTINKTNAIVNKLKYLKKFTIAKIIERTDDIEFNEVMHKAGAYYRIEVIVYGVKVTTVNVSEIAWEAA